MLVEADQNGQPGEDVNGLLLGPPRRVPGAEAPRLVPPAAVEDPQVGVVAKTRLDGDIAVRLELGAGHDLPRAIS